MKNNRLITVLRHHRILLGACAGVLLANLLFSVFAVGGQKRKIEALRGLYLSTRRVVSAPEKKDDRAAIYREESKALLDFGRGLPPVSGIADQAEELFRYITGAGLSTTMLNYRSEPVKGAPRLLRYTASFTVTGSYPALKRLLTQIRGSSKLFCIEKISFEKNPDEGETVDMRLSLSTYFDRRQEEP